MISFNSNKNKREPYYQEKWTNKLYIKHPFPDNYVEKSEFLKFRRINCKYFI